jgi:hypothetical protein
MSKKTRSVPIDLVKHPRFGSTIRPSGFEVDAGTLRASFWRYHDETIFPETAIPANLQKQNYLTIPCGWYVDVLKTCRDCRRKFIFYALEQQHWYEVLRFNLDADCVRCPECRKADQTLRRRFLRFSKSIQRKDLSNEELATLVADAVFLWDNGLLSKRDKLNRIRNQARRRIPDHSATRDIETLVAGLDGCDAADWSEDSV